MGGKPNCKGESLLKFTPRKKGTYHCEIRLNEAKTRSRESVCVVCVCVCALTATYVVRKFASTTQMSLLTSGPSWDVAATETEDGHYYDVNCYTVPNTKPARSFLMLVFIHYKYQILSENNNMTVAYWQS